MFFKSKPDITSREDIEAVVSSFYQKAIEDPEIGHFFTNVRELDLDHHIPRICDFWEGVLLGASHFKGNPMQVHLQLDKDSALKQNHFDQWIAIWIANIKEQYKGPKAQEAIDRAKNIAMIMSLKIQDSRKG